MTSQQIVVFAIIAAAVALFIWGRIRYDLVAFGALLATVLAGLVEPENAFIGFADPAVVTVAAVLVISQGLTNSGMVDMVAQYIVPPLKSMTLKVSAMSGIAASLSAVMNNVGALSLLMPSAISAGKRQDTNPSLLLMPLSFASLLGGLVTMIGTPPNIVIANVRREEMGTAFSMFDFTPVGATVAAAGVLFLALGGWRLVPRKRAEEHEPEELAEIDDYVCEMALQEESDYVGKSLGDLDDCAFENDVTIAGTLRGDRRTLYTSRGQDLKAGDTIIVEGGPDSIDRFASDAGLDVSAKPLEDTDVLEEDEKELAEVVVSGNSPLIARTAADIKFRSRYGVNMLGVSRRGQEICKKLAEVEFQAGDVLLFQGDRARILQTVRSFDLLPLTERRLRSGRRGEPYIAAGLLAGAVAMAAAGALALSIALSLAAFAMVVLRIVPPRDLYGTIDWPVLVLIGAMIPVGQAMENTGATLLIADLILALSGTVSVWVITAVLIAVTMTLSDVMNNVATAVIMGPVAVSMAQELTITADAFLMAVAIGASCAFLTPIGHKNNALIMGPGGYRFGDYWRMGLPLELLIVAVATPMIMLVWT